MRHLPQFPHEDGFTFKDSGEVLVYRALKRAQDELFKSGGGSLAIFPLPSGIVHGSQAPWEPDFLVTLNKRAGIIEVDGRSHHGRYVADATRDHFW